MTTAEPPRLIPTGTCWCGCGKETGIGAFWARGHDKIAEAALTAAEYGGSVARLLHHYGYGPERPVIDEAVRQGDWEACGTGDCWYKGTRESVRGHKRKYLH
ncbi:hypothetical protein OG559_13215 [Micromonospora sp. NBC_01405]|uniref:hypothetical protein n=1 Tax=Micromonospora sp. NBC_01405 TaxID=2903589 RepID=UPI0032467F10